MDIIREIPTDPSSRGPWAYARMFRKWKIEMTTSWNIHVLRLAKKQKEKNGGKIIITNVDSMTTY